MITIIIIMTIIMIIIIMRERDADPGGQLLHAVRVLGLDYYYVYILEWKRTTPRIKPPPVRNCLQKV